MSMQDESFDCAMEAVRHRLRERDLQDALATVYVVASTVVKFEAPEFGAMAVALGRVCFVLAREMDDHAEKARTWERYADEAERDIRLEHTKEDEQ